ncbi:hypothetical protein MMC11_001607 [Xylographa trunciseda]|nr:hypothetical protein [Xylographa trunciseda]
MSPSSTLLSLLSSTLLLFLFPTLLLLLSSLPTAAAAAAASSSICYAADGVQSDNLPCYPDQTDSTCCMPGFKCISNGLCAPGPNITGAITPFYVGDCTDPTWSSPECLTECANSGGNGVQPCANAGPGNFCCYGLSNADCCSNATLVFDLGVGTIVSVTSMTSTTSTASSTSGTSLVTTTSSAAVVTSSAPAATSSAAASTNNGVAIGVGAGVGIPVGLAIIAGVFYFLVWKPKRKRRWTQTVNQPPSAAGANTGAGYGAGYKRPVYEPGYRGGGYVPVGKDGVHEMQGLRGTELPAEAVDDSQRGPAELG